MVKRTDICEDCGKKFPKKELIYGPCPYTQDIYNEEVDSVLCKDCYQERCADI